jgi:fatty-acid desaturase
MRLDDNVYKIFIPLHVLAIVGVFYILDYWLSFLIIWFLIGVIGNGVAGHRYFAHGQFETYTPIRWVLGFLCSLGGFGPATDWRIQHKVHHLRSDKETDPHSPLFNNKFQVFYGWYFHQKKHNYIADRFVKRIAIEQLRDPYYKFFDKHHFKIVYIFILVLLLIDPVLVYIYGLAFAVDFFRLGSVNYFCHRSGYRNHDTNDGSRNNLWLGWLGMGFGWHNTHHAHPGKLILQEKWWEIDIEGYIGWLLSKKQASQTSV